MRVFKGIANSVKIQFNRENKEGKWIMSGEDLANVGPVALLNDLTVMSSIGINCVERNDITIFQDFRCLIKIFKKRFVWRILISIRLDN